jgi:hypothetical protein
VPALTQEWLCGDGLDIIELFIAAEREYGIELPESFHERERTLGDLFAHVAQDASQGPGPSPSDKRTPSGNVWLGQRESAMKVKAARTLESIRLRPVGDSSATRIKPTAKGRKGLKIQVETVRAESIAAEARRVSRVSDLLTQLTVKFNDYTRYASGFYGTFKPAVIL